MEGNLITWLLGSNVEPDDSDDIPDPWLDSTFETLSKIFPQIENLIVNPTNRKSTENSTPDEYIKKFSSFKKLKKIEFRNCDNMYDLPNLDTMHFMTELRFFNLEYFAFYEFEPEFVKGCLKVMPSPIWKFGCLKKLIAKMLGII